MSHQLLAVLLAVAIAAGVDARQLPPDASKGLGAAVADVVGRFNANEEKLRDHPRVEATGPAGEPSMLRATYRRARPQHQITAVEPGAAPVVTVRVRAVEFEKRATNVNSNVEGAFKAAPWRETPRGYLLDFQLRWNGKTWEQMGEPAAAPTLGVVGEP
jgi:hypothetical protein